MKQVNFTKPTSAKIIPLYKEIMNNRLAINAWTAALSPMPKSETIEKEGFYEPRIISITKRELIIKRKPIMGDQSAKIIVLR